jgi:hypothetical protein
LIFENARIECDLVTNLELIMRLTHRFREHFQKLSKRGARIRIIVENLDNEDLVKRTLEKMKPNRGNFAAKLIYKSKSLPYQITDHKEVWISGKKKLNRVYHVYCERMAGTWSNSLTKASRRLGITATQSAFIQKETLQERELAKAA